MPTTASKIRASFGCTACGESASRWQGRCSACGEWNSVVEIVGRRGKSAAPTLTTTSLANVPSGESSRIASGIAEFDRVLGGGIVPGALILLGGDPGVGKSTLALQLADQVGSEDLATLYCAGEESLAQLGLRAGRIGCASSRIDVVAETDLDLLVGTISQQQPKLAIVDSVQTVYDSTSAGVAGSPAQVRSVVARLMACAKQTGIAIMLIGHVTKEGAIAGPRTLEHMVDVVLYLEGERQGDYRLLRGIKNRFGSTGELGIFNMTEQGMQPLDAPGRAFLDDASLGVAGNVLTVSCEGARPLAIEVQALTASTSFGLPRRAASGFDLGRLHLLLAVLEKRAKIALDQSDVYVNAVAGVRLAEPAADLAVALAVAASARDLVLPKEMVVLGEIGLGGEVRSVRRLDARLNEALQLGMTEAIIPAAQAQAQPKGMRCHAVATLADAVKLLR